MNRTRIIIVDGIEIHTSLSATEIADLEQKNKELINKIKFNEKSRRKMQQSLMKQINELEHQCKKQKEVIDDCKEDISNLLNVINKNCNELKCTYDEWLVIQKYQDKEVSK